MKNLITKNALALSIAGFALMIGASVTAFAHHHHGGKVAFEACFQQATDGKVASPKQMTDAQRESVHACMQEKFAVFHQDMVKCMSDAKVAMPNWQPGQQKQNLDPVTRTALHACRKQVKASLASAPAASVAPAASSSNQ